MTQTITNIKPRIMFIIWKWQDIPAVNEYFLQKRPQLLEDISTGHEVIFDHFEVENHAHDKVIRANIYNYEGTKPLVDEIINFYLKDIEGAQVYLFLHRGHAYGWKNVDDFLKTTPVNKCFLFSDQRDFIYFNTKDEGLLNDVGDFKISDTVKVADKSNKKVVKQHFDAVWQYYEEEFQQKLYQLHSDLSSYLFSSLSNELSAGKPIPVQLILQKLKEDEHTLLYQRLKSFLNLYPQRFTYGVKAPKSKITIYQEGKLPELKLEEAQQLNEEMNALIRFEKKAQQSFTFDDCITNLMESNHARYDDLREKYQQVKQYLAPIIGEENTNYQHNELSIILTTLQEMGADKVWG